AATTALGWTPGRGAGGGCSTAATRAYVAYGFLTTRLATGHSGRCRSSRITAPARVVARRLAYAGFARNVTASGPAFDSVATRATTASAGPCSTQPKRSASSPSVNGIRGYRARGLRARRPTPPRSRIIGSALRPSSSAHPSQDGVGDVDVAVDVDRVVDDQVVPLVAAVSLNRLQHLIADLRHLLVLANLEILLVLGRLPLELACAVTELALERRPLLLRKHRAVSLVLLLLLLHLLLEIQELALPRRELGLERSEERRVGKRRGT